jgi:preprotein translocase subunit SecA
MGRSTARWTCPSTGWTAAAAPERRRAYAADVTYVTAKEAGFDHLRDLLARDRGDLVHRPLHFALLDEADSLLVDEARVPWSSPARVEGVLRGRADGRSDVGLVPGVHFSTDEYGRNVELTEAGYEHVERALGCGSLVAEENYGLLTELHCAPARARPAAARRRLPRARGAASRSWTSSPARVVEDRHWPDGLQAALEAKEGLARRGADGSWAR